MASLRSRLIAVLLAVAAVGLLALAAITYAEQRSFQLERVDRQVLAARPVMEHQLVEGGGPFGPGPGPRDRPGPDGEDVSLPPGTYGELRDAGGARVGDPVVLTYGQDGPSPPDLPAQLPPGETVTVDAIGGGGSYRARAEPERGGSVVVAVPLTEAQATLNRLLVLEALVIAGVLAVLGVVAFLVVRLALRPLDRIADTAGAIAGGELSRRVEPATPRTEVGRLGLALNAMLDRLEEAFARREESEDRLRRFLSDASHELRTPPASIRGYAELFRMGAVRGRGARFLVGLPAA
jgi:two-component system OmpR family sensor kinase